MRKRKLISKFVTPHTGKQIITIHIMLNLSRRKSNKTIKIDMLIIEGNLRNIFLEK